VSLTLTLKVREVKIDDQVYTVRELNGTERGAYLNSVGGRVIINDQGKAVGMKDFTGLEALLLKRCLYGPDGVLVTEKTLATWPASVLGTLFDIAKDLSALNEESKKKVEEEAKNA